MPERVRTPLLTTRLDRRYLQPARTIAITFLIAICLGTLLLSLPQATTSRAELGFLDTLFTATSAVCVTGLVLADTGSAFTRFGQVVILLLIQVGGLGILSLGSVVAFLLRRRITYRQRMHLQSSVNAQTIGGVVGLVRGILIFTFASELVGAAILWTRFAPIYGASEGAYYALFHSVSAFNNAGFALFPDSLERFANDPVMLLTISALLILGGLGFLVAVNAAWHLAGKRRRLTLHSRIALLSSFVLLVGGTLLLLGFEWDNPFTLGPLPVGQKLLNAFFQAASPRTAGFNSLDYAGMREVSLFLTVVLMFIGANPASTGGGIKTVTAFVIFSSAISEVRGKNELEVMGRRVPSALVLKAGTVALFSFFVITIALLVLSITDPVLEFLPMAFEAFSAFATVGLSTGITSSFSDLGKVVLIVLMYVGRLGPTTFALALVSRQRDDHVRYPAEEVIIG